MNSLSVNVWGPFACFSRPDFKIEYVSYPIMTPSAAKGILESIYWKPQMKWVIKEIHILKPICYMSYAVNIVNKLASKQSIIYVEDSNVRVQRHAKILHDVSYNIIADIELLDGNNLVKHRDQFRRRVEKGKSFRDVFLGCREFQASFAEVKERPLPINQNLGNILKSVNYGDDPISFDFMPANIKEGILRVQNV